MYRANPNDGVAWVTGASSGIGRQVALDLAGRGYTVIATARRSVELVALAEAATGLTGRIVPTPGDACDAAAMRALVADITRDHGAIALAFLNVGVNVADPADPWAADAGWQTFTANVGSIVCCLDPLVAAMQAKGRGQIALNGSLSSYVGIPGSSYYGASKAAVQHLAETLRASLRRDGLTVQLVSPGFVRTPLTAKVRFPMPFIMSVEAAARRIVAGFERAGFEITFPRRLSYGLKILRILPYWAFFPLVNAVIGSGPRRDDVNW